MKWISEVNKWSEVTKSIELGKWTSEVNKWSTLIDNIFCFDKSQEPTLYGIMCLSDTLIHR